MSEERTYKLVEIFDSFQGEGAQMGIPYTFVRFSYCNLKCKFCDTPYNQVNMILTEDILVKEILERQPGWICFTGGEPLLQLTQSLVNRLHGQGLRIAIETNGQTYNEVLRSLDYVVISPKSPSEGIPLDKCIHKSIVRDVKAGLIPINELRYIIVKATDDVFHIPILMDALHVYVSPVFEQAPRNWKMSNWKSGDGHTGTPTLEDVAFQRCLEIMARTRSWIRPIRLSLQTHKFVGAR